MKNRLLYADALRTFSILAMLLFHSTGAYFYSKTDHNWWFIADILRSASAVCVPLFFMLSGMLLLDSSKQQESISTFFKKRFFRIAVPTIGWIIIYLLYKIYVKGNDIAGIEVIKVILQGPVYFHLWFLYALIGLYLVTPILRVYTSHATDINLLYFIILWLIITGILPILKDFFDIRIGIRVVVTTGWAGYFIAGYYLNKIILTKQQIYYALAVFAACLLSTTYLLDYFTFTNPSNFANYFMKYRTPNIIIMSFSIFMIIRSLDYEKIAQKKPFIMKIIKYLSSTSFAIYLVHILILENLRSGDFGFKIHALGGATNYPLIGIPVTFTATLIISLIVISTLRKVPYIRAIVT